MLNMKDVLPDKWANNDRVFSRTSLLQEIDANPAPTEARMISIVEILNLLNSTSKHVETSMESEKQCGVATSKRMQYRLKCAASYTVDHFNKTNANKRQQSLFEPDNAGLNVCQKEFPVNAGFTPGTFIAGCGCSSRKVLLANLMDSHESALSPFDILLNRFPYGCPPFVIYDNACHLQKYCMSREPIYFWQTRMCVDKFHEVNHVNSCSSSLHTSSYESGPLTDINTQAVEQINAKLRKRAEHRLRMMNLNNAVEYFRVFFGLFNYSSA